MSETFIDLDALLGGTPRYTRTVHGRQVTLDDILFSEMPKMQRIYGQDYSFGAVYDAAWAILSSAEVEPALGREWFDGLSHAEAVSLVVWQINPTGAAEPIPEEQPLTLRLRGLTLTIPPFTLADAKFFSEHVNGHDASLERLVYLADRITVDGSPLPDGFITGLKGREVDALVTAFVSREFEAEAKNANAPTNGASTKPGNGTKSRRSSAKSTVTN